MALTNLKSVRRDAERGGRDARAPPENCIPAGQLLWFHAQRRGRRGRRPQHAGARVLRRKRSRQAFRFPNSLFSIHHSIGLSSVLALRKGGNCLIASCGLIRLTVRTELKFGSAALPGSSQRLDVTSPGDWLPDMDLNHELRGFRCFHCCSYLPFFTFTCTPRYKCIPRMASIILHLWAIIGRKTCAGLCGCAGTVRKSNSVRELCGRGRQRLRFDRQGAPGLASAALSHPPSNRLP